MATLDALKGMLRKQASEITSTPTQALSDAQYKAGFNILTQGSGWLTYKDFIIPQLSLLLTPFFAAQSHISVLEIGPGPQSVLGYLPSHLTQNINKYTAFEPNDSYASDLAEWLPNASDSKFPFHCLEHPPDIHRTPFTLDASVGDDLGHFNLVLFCHSMYGLSPKREFIEKALNMLVEQLDEGMVVVFHRDGTLHLDGLVCHQTASFPVGTVHVQDDKKALDKFAPFIAGFVMEDSDMNETVQAEWRKTCRTWGDRTEAHPNHLQFSAPNIKVAFTRQATALPDLVAKVPFLTESKMIKSQEPVCINPPRSSD